MSFSARSPRTNAGRLWSTLGVTAVDGRNWTRPSIFRINDTGLWKVQFLLFKDGDFSSPYRELHMYLRGS